jgi:hypothetical protein
MLFPLPASATTTIVAGEARTVSQEFSKSVQREFPIQADGTVSLHNRHGKTTVRTWSKPMTRIDVTIRVEARTAEDAADVFERIDIDFSNTPRSVRAETVISSSNSWWSWGGSDDKYEIDYLVHLPASVNLELEHHYGDVVADPLDGKADVRVKYGNVRLEGIRQELRLELSYGNGTVVEARQTDAKIAYGKLYVNKTNRATLLTRYSKIFIDQATEAVIDSRYDQFEIGPVEHLDVDARYGNLEIESVSSIRCKANYTDIIIRQLTESGDFDMSYGGLRILHLPDRFSQLLLTGQYTDFRVAVAPEAAYTLEATCSYADLRYPANLQITLDQTRSTSREVKGYARQQQATGRIKATASYGGLRLSLADR